MQSSLRYCWSYLNCPKSLFKFCQVWLQKLFCSPRLVSRPPCSLINGSRTEMERQMHNAAHILQTTMQDAMQCKPQCIPRRHPFLSTMHTAHFNAMHTTMHSVHSTMHSVHTPMHTTMPPPFPPFPSRAHASPHPGPSPPSSCLITFTFFSVHCPAIGHVC